MVGRGDKRDMEEGLVVGKAEEDDRGMGCQ